MLSRHAAAFIALLSLSLGLLAVACSRGASPPPPDRASSHTPQAARLPHPPAAMSSYRKPPPEQVRARLSPLQYEVTQRDATEPPFANRYWDNKRPGLYVDVVTGEPLFLSRDKFDSGTGWPSFMRPVEPHRVVSRADATLGMPRTEVRSAAGDSHLGHVFDDGPGPEGKRYCINSASLRFVPRERMQEQGYGQYLAGLGGAPGAPPPPAGAGTANSCTSAPQPGCQATLQTAVLAGGCFWGMEEILRKVPGVVDTEVGYAGGDTDHPGYEQVKTGRTGHAEAVRVVFDPTRLSYRELLEKWFFRMHDPTTLNRQGNDVGSQYRSAIFVSSTEQRRVAEEVKRAVASSGKWQGPIVTEIVEAGPFTPAESYHQDYLERHPSGYTCHYLRD